MAKRYWILANGSRYCAFDEKNDAKLCLRYFIEQGVSGELLDIEEDEISSVGGCLYEHH